MTAEEEEDFLRELTALFFVLSSGGDVFKLLSSTVGGGPDGDVTQQRVAADFAALLSQANGVKLPFKGIGVKLLFFSFEPHWYSERQILISTVH